MAGYTYERLTAQDNSFLVAETRTIHMHVAGTQIFDAGPLATPDGGIDIEAIKRATEAVLHLIPRYRQRLRWIPFENHPVWVDDRQFNLDYHIRHTALPRPGGVEQLKHLSARVMAQQLDRSRPLWETWVVEGLEGNRFALISKVHHCMMDGVSGVDLAHILLSPFAEGAAGEPLPYIPRPAPSGWQLAGEALRRRFGAPLQLIRDFDDFLRQTRDPRAEILARTQALAELLGWAVRPAPPTPLNGRLSPHRRFDWLTVSLAEAKAIRKAFGCTLNDVVLTTVAGGVREFLMRRRVRPEFIDFRVSAPVSMRREEERGRLGNRVSSWIIRLPIGEADPVKRLQEIHHVTRELKASRQALGVEMMMELAEWTPTVLLSLGARAASGPINMIVTNVPGPQIPLYLLGARMLEAFPLVPLLENTGVGIALFSYDGKLCWGFNGDYDLVPDMRFLVSAVEASFKELADAAGVVRGRELESDVVAAGPSLAIHAPVEPPTPRHAPAASGGTVPGVVPAPPRGTPSPVRGH